MFRLGLPIRPKSQLVWRNFNQQIDDGGKPFIKSRSKCFKEMEAVERIHRIDSDNIDGVT